MRPSQGYPRVLRRARTADHVGYPGSPLAMSNELQLAAASVLIAKFVALRRELGHEFRDLKDTSKIMVVV